MGNRPPPGYAERTRSLLPYALLGLVVLGGALFVLVRSVWLNGAPLASFAQRTKVECESQAQAVARIAKWSSPEARESALRRSYRHCLEERASWLR
jgi:hypothetical protein